MGNKDCGLYKFVALLSAVRQEIFDYRMDEIIDMLNSPAHQSVSVFKTPQHAPPSPGLPLILP